MSPGSTEYVGPYRLLRCLREGKSCQVWEVIKDIDGRRYAIKLLAHSRQTKQEVAFLKHEYAVGAKLDHPRVIHVYDFGHSHRDYFLVLELCATQNLKQAIYPSVEAIAPRLEQIIIQCAEGLAYLHSQGWVHRDVKPDNFLVTPNWEMKLIDFALAQRMGGGLARLFSRSSRQVQGTRSYMSPEQIRCQSLDARADIYSFGCMCFELASGKLPFTGVTTTELLNKHLRNPAPPLPAFNNNVTEDFARLVARMLAKEPNQRPRSLDEVLAELRGLRIFKMQPKLVSG